MSYFLLKSTTVFVLVANAASFGPVLLHPTQKYATMNKIKKSEFCDFEHLCYLVYETVTDYFGYNYNLEKRLQIFKTIDEVHNKIRGLSPWPTATAVLGGKKVKLHSSEKTELKGGAPGEITVSHGEMLVACKDGKLLKILELQPEGKKRMSAEAFLLGHKIQSGDSFK